MFWIKVIKGKYWKKRQCIRAMVCQRILPETEEQKRLFPPKWSSRTLVRTRSQTTAHWRRQRAHEAPSRARLASQVSRPPPQLLVAFLHPRTEIHATGLKMKNSFCSDSPVFLRWYCLRVHPTPFATHSTTPCGPTLTPGGRNMNYRRAETLRFYLIIGCK